jgi:hypothetical protein
MTVHHPKRTAAVNVGAQPKSSAYARSKRGPLEISAQQLREGVSNVSSRKDPGDVQQSFLQVRAPQWYLYTRALLERHFYYDEPIATCAAALGISNEEAESIITQAVHVGEHKIGLKFQFANSSNAKYPRSPKEPCVKLLAEEIALRLDKLARDNPTFLEEGVWTYISNVHKTNRLVLTAPAQAPNLRKWMALVRKLQGEDLSIRVMGFLVDGVKGSLDQPMKLLNLSRSTPIHWVNAKNQNSRAALNHLGIDVVGRLERKRESILLSSEAFRYAMAIAAIAQIWRLHKTQECETAPSEARIEPVLSVESLQQSFSEQDESVDTSEEQGEVCGTCNSPLPPLPRPSAEPGCDGDSGASLRSVFMHFIWNTDHWSCHFLMDDLRTALRKTLTFRHEEKVLEAARNGRAGLTSEDERLIQDGIAMGRGGAWLRLTEDQYQKLE